MKPNDPKRTGDEFSKSDGLDVDLKLAEESGWRRRKLQGGEVWLAGQSGGLETVKDLFVVNEFSDLQIICKRLAECYDHFALVAEFGSCILAVVDRIRSYPIFYHFRNGKPVAIASTPRKFSIDLTSANWDRGATLEFAMAGYVSGRETLLPDVKQLLPGELLMLNKESGEIKLERYHRYLPQPQGGQSDADWLDELHELMHRIFVRVKEKAEGAPILIPLSGGWDSRLIAAQLAQLGYDQLQTISYGTPGNHEARIAKNVAERLGVPWQFAPELPAESRRVYHHANRLNYWRQADFLCGLPNMQEWYALSALVHQRRLPSDTVIVNGQSGDYLTGGHIPEELFTDDNATAEEFFAVILEKHYSQWRQLLTADNRNTIRQRITSVMSEFGEILDDRENLIMLHEAWEYQERQCKYVVNGQRLYDFLGFHDWQLPLWDGEFISFWRRVPFHLKYHQELYRRYLMAFDYYGVFTEIDNDVSRWPRKMGWVPWLARGVGLVGGAGAKEGVYQRLRYFGHYRHHFAPFGYGRYLRHVNDARGSNSFYIYDWLLENGLEGGIAALG